MKQPIAWHVRLAALAGALLISGTALAALPDAPPARPPAGDAAQVFLSAVTVDNLRCEHVRNPLGLDVPQPRLSWERNSLRRGDLQIAYQILVAASPARLAQDQGDLWDSGKIFSDQQTLVTYAGAPLHSGQACFWKVRVWDNSGHASVWSAPASWTMGLLDPADWGAQWIGLATATNLAPAAPSPLLRQTFTVPRTVARATVYICGLGYYELLLNGVKVGDHVLDPTFTRYDRQADYVTYDVTTNLVPGPNAIGVQLANGFYNQWSPDAWNSAKASWRARPQLLLRLDIEYTDGTHAAVVSDPTWKAAPGPVLLDETRLGEVYDARQEKPGWATAAYDASAWTNAIPREGVAGKLIAPDAEPIKVAQTLTAVRIQPVTDQPGVYTFDFGQNLAGWGRLNVTGPAGTTVRLVFGEKTNTDGSVYQGNINQFVSFKQYFQTDTYTLKGGGPESWEPAFTYHGFQYVQVTGLTAPPTTNTLVARVVHTDLESAGSFQCANALLNRIEACARWSYLGNFVGIPTDCPQREKNGWAGDAQLACEIGLTHFHSAAAYTRWLREFSAGQRPDGGLYGVIPNAEWGANVGPPWESAYLLIANDVCQHCGDIRILTNNYAGMRAYVDYLTRTAKGDILADGLGDWLPAATETPSAVTGTAYYYADALIVARTAALMGRPAEAQHYRQLAAQIKTTFNQQFYQPSTRLYAGGTLTAQSTALALGLVPNDQITGVADALAATVQANGQTVDTGIIGSKFLLRALCDNGHADQAWALAVQTNHPSWGYMITHGATTLWETWDGSGSGTSLNHIMFGDISAWFIEYVGGIRPGSPGYQTVLIKPEVMNSLTSARASHHSPYGLITSDWQVDGKTIHLNVTIPPGSTARVWLPALGTELTNLVIQESGTTIWQNGLANTPDPGVQFDHPEGTFPQTWLVWTVASGSYHFSWNATPLLTALTATPGDRQVALHWNTVAGATAYNVQRIQVPGGPSAVVATGLPRPDFTDTGLTNQTCFKYTITAVNPAGPIATSAPVRATPAWALNLGFELPVINNYRYQPAGAAWTYMHTSADGSGLVANGSAFGNPPAPEGRQAAFIQAHGRLSQTLSGFTPGTHYTLTFAAAQRAGANQHGGQTWEIRLDDTVIASFNPGPAATHYIDYAATFVATAPTHRLTFAGTDLPTGDNTVFLDHLRLTPTLQPTGSP